MDKFGGNGMAWLVLDAGPSCRIATAERKEMLPFSFCSTADAAPARRNHPGPWLAYDSGTAQQAKVTLGHVRDLLNIHQQFSQQSANKTAFCWGFPTAIIS